MLSRKKLHDVPYLWGPKNFNLKNICFLDDSEGVTRIFFGAPQIIWKPIFPSKILLHNLTIRIKNSEMIIIWPIKAILWDKTTPS